MLNRPAFYLCLLCLILMTSLVTSAGRRRQKSRRHRGLVTSRTASKSDVKDVERGDDVPLSQTPETVDEMSIEAASRNCKDCSGDPANSIRVPRSRRNGRRRRRRLRHRRRHRSQGQRGRGKGGVRRREPGEEENAEAESSEHEDGALNESSLDPNPSEKSSDSDRVLEDSKSLKSVESQRELSRQLSESANGRTGDEEGPSSSMKNGGQPEEFTADQGSLSSSSYSSKSASGSRSAAKKSPSKRRKGKKRRKSRKVKSSKKTEDSKKEVEKGKTEAADSDSDSFWGMFSFWSPEKSEKPEEEEEEKEEVRQEEEEEAEEEEGGEEEEQEEEEQEEEDAEEQEQEEEEEQEQEEEEQEEEQAEEQEQEELQEEQEQKQQKQENRRRGGRRRGSKRGRRGRGRSSKSAGRRKSSKLSKRQQSSSKSTGEEDEAEDVSVALQNEPRSSDVMADQSHQFSRSSSKSRSGSRSKSKKSSRKRKKNKRRKSKKAKSSKVKKEDKKNVQKDDAGSSDSFWSAFSFWGPEKSDDSEKPEEEKSVPENEDTTEREGEEEMDEEGGEEEVLVEGEEEEEVEQEEEEQEQEQEGEQEETPAKVKSDDTTQPPDSPESESARHRAEDDNEARKPSRRRGRKRGKKRNREDDEQEEKQESENVDETPLPDNAEEKRGPDNDESENQQEPTEPPKAAAETPKTPHRPVSGFSRRGQRGRGAARDPGSDRPGRVNLDLKKTSIARPGSGQDDATEQPRHAERGEDRANAHNRGGGRHDSDGDRGRDQDRAGRDRHHDPRGQDAEERRRHQLLSSLNRRRQDPDPRSRPEDQDRSGRGHHQEQQQRHDTSRRQQHRERHRDDRRDRRRHHEDIERRSRRRHNDEVSRPYRGHHRYPHHQPHNQQAQYDAEVERYEARRRERQRQMEESARQREHALAMRMRERERLDEETRRRERQRQAEMRRRHRERQEELKRQDNERLDKMRRERERLIMRRRERQRLEAAEWERKRKEHARRMRERKGVWDEEDGDGEVVGGNGGGGVPQNFYHRGRYQNGNGRHHYDYPSRPAAADRLERRLFPDIHTPTLSLLKSMQRTMQALTGGLQAVRDTNQFIFNGTRYTIMMGVRRQLKELAKANDMVYETILRSTLLTKDIYMRAHQRRLTGPTTRSLERPDISLPGLYDVIRSAYDEERKAIQTLRNVEDMKRRHMGETTRLEQVRERFQDNFARNDLKTLIYYVNSTVLKLGTELTLSTHVAYRRRHVAMLSTSRGNLTEARELIHKAADMLARGTEHYRGNYRVVQDWRRLKTNPNDQGVGPPVSIRQRHRRYISLRDHVTASRRIRDLTAAERRRLRSMIDRLKKLAQEKQRLASDIERMLRPSITAGQKAMSTKDETAASAWLASLASRVDKDVKKMMSLLDTIRVLIGSTQELRWGFISTSTSSRRPCAEGGDDVEGSGCDDELVEEGSGDDDGGVTTVTTDDEDFVFIDENDKDKQTGPPLLEFGDKLADYLGRSVLRSRELLDSGDRLFVQTEKLSERWKEMKESYGQADKARKLWKQTKDIMENVTASADDVNDVMPKLSERISRSYETIKIRAAKAVEIAERKLAEAQAQKGGEDKEDDAAADEEAPDTDDSDSIVIEALEKAEQAKREVGAVRSLRRVAPQTCGRASGQLVTLHTNISHLRQQVHTALTLLKDMQLAIAKSGSGYLSIPVLQKTMAPTPTPTPSAPTPTRFPPTLQSSSPTPLSMVTTVEVCVRTQDIDGSVLLVKGNNSFSFGLTMSGRQLSVTVYDVNGYDKGSVTSDVTMLEDTWYNVKVVRSGKRVVLSVKSRDGSEPAVSNDVSVSAMMYLQPTPVHVYVGGVADNEPFSEKADTWRGCLGDLRVDGRSLPLFQPSSTGQLPGVCPTQCASSGSNSLVFDGNGFIHFPASVLPVRKRMESIHFRFRSRQGNAALLNLVNKRQRFLLRVVLDNGALVVDTTTVTESITLRSQSNGYNDNAFHSLRIQYRDSTAYPELDGQDGAFTIERSRPQNVNNRADGIIIGSFVTGSLEFEKSKYRPFMGCLRELEIDDSPLSFTQAMTSVGVFSGSCHSQSVWQECVQFDEDSTGLDLGSMDRSGTVVMLFSPLARGPLLTYTREGKFESEVAATDSGLQVNTEDKELSIARPDDATHDFALLTITDDGKNVKFSVWDEEEEVSYGSFWAAGADVDGAHEIKVGTSLDDASDRQLFGQIAQLMVGHRLIALTNHTDTSQLSPCERPLPTLTVLDTAPEGTTAPPVDDVTTCSLDIQC